MKQEIRSAAEMGLAVRAARKAQRIRQDDAAAMLGVSQSFMVKLERGSDSVQWSKLFQILDGLGVRITVDIPLASPELLADVSSKASVRSERVQRRTADRQLAAGDKNRSGDE